MIIKRSPTIENSASPPSKIAKTSSRQSTTSNASSKTSRQSSVKEEESANPPTANPAVTATAPKSTSDKVASPIDATLPHGSMKEPESPNPVASRTDEKRQDQHKKGEHKTEESTRNRNGHIVDNDNSANNVTYNNKHVTVNGHNNNNTISEELSSVLTSPGSDYWLARNPVADQVFITDVTVNLRTVTIRECKTEKGFFKERSNNTKPSDIV